MAGARTWTRSKVDERGHLMKRCTHWMLTFLTLMVLFGLACSASSPIPESAVDGGVVNATDVETTGGVMTAMSLGIDNVGGGDSTQPNSSPSNPMTTVPMPVGGVVDGTTQAAGEPTTAGDATPIQLTGGDADTGGTIADVGGRDTAMLQAGQPMSAGFQGGQMAQPMGAGAIEVSDEVFVRLSTRLGTMTFRMLTNDAPISVANFLAYVDAGFYDGQDGQGATTFHRVIPDFMVQGGGVLASGQRKSTRPPIINESTNGLENRRGTVAFARTNDPNSATSQFFVNVVDK